MPEKRRLTERARDAYNSAGERIIEARDKTKETIEEHPFTSVIVAAAIGAAVGVLASETIRAMRRRNRR